MHATLRYGAGLIVLGALAWAPSFAEARSALRGRIVFCGGGGISSSIVSMKPDGSDLKKLTEGGYREIMPAVSPDGREIAFVSNREGSYDIFVMNVDGSGVRNVTKSKSRDWGPSWSPNGRLLAFTSDRSGHSDIFVMDADGRNVKALTDDDADDETSAGSWSPDGRRILFTTNRFFEKGRRGSWSWEICVISPSGKNLKRLTENREHYDGKPSWSPDGRRIAFASGREGGRKFESDIFTMNPDGSKVKRVSTGSRKYTTNPAWSRDGKALVYEARGKHMSTALLTINIDGTGASEITSEKGSRSNSYPIWIR